MEDYKNYITNVPGFPKPGIQFKDITTLIETPGMLQDICYEMVQLMDKESVHKIVCADARGFIFGAGLSVITGIPLVLVRKPGKLPRPGLSVDYTLEYGSNTLEISAGSINPGDHCVIVDDLLATGGSAMAMEKLIARSGGVIWRELFVIELMDLCGREKLSVPVDSFVKYGIAPGEMVLADLEGIVDEDQLRYYGTAPLNVEKVEDDFVVCGWKYEDRVTSMRIPKNKIKAIIGIDGTQREYLE